MIQPGKDTAATSPPSVGKRHVAAMRAKNIARNRQPEPGATAFVLGSHFGADSQPDDIWQGVAVEGIRETWDWLPRIPKRYFCTLNNSTAFVVKLYCAKIQFSHSRSY